MTTDLSQITTLGHAAQVFTAQPGPRKMIKNALFAWAVRAVLGPPKLSELSTAGAILAFWPLQEWLIHRHILHFEPRTIRGRHVDLLVAKSHRAHHRDPRDLHETLIPEPVVRVALPVTALVFALASFGSLRRAASGTAVYATMSLLYEWTHFLAHTSYRPRGRVMDRIRKNHLRHHFHNEDYYLGVTFPVIDDVLATNPATRAVPRSATARGVQR